MQLLCCNRRFSTRSKAEDYTAKYTRPRDLLFEDPTAILFTDGSALPNGPPGWGIHITVPGSDETQALWGPVVTSASHPTWIGATQPTSSIGELSANYHAINRRRRTWKSH